MNEPFALLDHSLFSKKDSFLFTKPLDQVRAEKDTEILQALEDVQKLSQQGFHCVGYVSYECGYSLQDITFTKKKEPYPLLDFYAFKNYKKVSNQEILSFFSTMNGYKGESPAFFHKFQMEVDEKSYYEKISLIKKYLAQGDSYQINYTQQSSLGYQGDLFQLYLKLRQEQPVEYGAFFNFHEVQILSFSPELFFRKSKGQITCQPMKGTGGRSPDPEKDKKIKEKMNKNTKLQCENLMIVDMVRNDLAQLAHSGSIQVPKLFEVHTYPTVHQMTSTVCAQLKENSLPLIFKKIFPCASITGAPKKSTMELIQKLEKKPRGIYTGALGWIQPNQDMIFNVAIRTLVNIKKGSCQLGVGGGVLFESSPQEEYQECLDKSLFIQKLHKNFFIFTSLLCMKGQCGDMEKHLDRLENSCRTFCFPTQREKWRSLLLQNSTSLKAPHKVRLEVYGNGDFVVKTHCLKDVEFTVEKPLFVDFNTPATDSKDIWLQHKTSHRKLYEKQYQEALEKGLYDRLFVNEKGEVTEACCHNIFVQMKDTLYTPPVACGVLPGIERGKILTKQYQALGKKQSQYPMGEPVQQEVQGKEKRPELELEKNVEQEKKMEEHKKVQKTREKILYPQDLRQADRVFLCNSIRGLVEVQILWE